MPMENPRRRAKAETTARSNKESSERGPHTEFTETVSVYAAEHGVSQERAKKELFSGLVKTFDVDLGERRRFISGDSAHFDMHATALEAALPTSELAALTAKGSGREHPSFRQVDLSPATQEELAASTQYLEERFKGATIIAPLASDYLNLTRELEVVTNRLSSDNRLATAESLSELLVRTGEVRADVSRMFEIRRSLARHEKHLLDQMRAKEAQRTLIEETRSYMQNAFADPLTAFFKTWKRSGRDVTKLGNVGAMVFAFLPLFAKFTFHSGKLLYRAATSIEKPYSVQAQ